MYFIAFIATPVNKLFLYQHIHSLLSSPSSFSWQIFTACTIEINRSVHWLTTNYPIQRQNRQQQLEFLNFSWKSENIKL